MDLEKLLLSLGFSAADLTKYKNEDTSTEDRDALVANYKKKRQEFYENTPEFLLKISDAAKGKMSVIKIKKMINKELGLGLTSAAIEEIKDIKEMYVLHAEKMKTEKANWGEADKDVLVAQINELKEKNTTQLNEIETLTTGRTDFEETTELKYSEVNRKAVVSKMIADVERNMKFADVPGKAFVLKAIRNEIETGYHITKDGVFMTKADKKVKASYPGQDRLIDSVEELYTHFAKEAKILPVSGGNKLPKVLDKNGKPVIQTNDLTPEEEAQMKELGALAGG